MTDVKYFDAEAVLMIAGSLLNLVTPFLRSNSLAKMQIIILRSGRSEKYAKHNLNI